MHGQPITKWLYLLYSIEPSLFDLTDQFEAPNLVYFHS
jgi:hypothetical protein